MKVIGSLLAGASALALFAGSACAADLYGNGGGSKDGVIATVGSPFAGANLSVGLGATWFSDNTDTYLTGDLRGGYNWVSKDGWLIGVYGELSLMDIPEATDPVLGYGAGFKLGKVIGGSSLAYVFGGYDAVSFAWEHVDGLTLGGGFETLIASHWTIGAEGAYKDYPNSGMGDAFTAKVRTTFYVN